MRALRLSSKRAQKVLDAIIGMLSSTELHQLLSEVNWVSAGDRVLLMSNVLLLDMRLTLVNMCVKVPPGLSVTLADWVIDILKGCTAENMTVRDRIPPYLTPGTDFLAVTLLVPPIASATFFLSSEVGELL